MTFESFVPGPCNRQALDAALFTARHPGGEPLYIFGPSGTGKTHLLRAVEDHIRRTRPELSLICVQSEQFLALLIQSIRWDCREEFDKTYGSAHVLLLDDLQFLADKPTTYETFLALCRKLHASGRQVVVTADRAPEDEFFSRGQVVGLELPRRETRKRIITAMSEHLGLALEPEVVELLTDSVTDSVRHIEGTLKRLLAWRDLMDLPPTLENAARILKDSEQ